MINKFNIIYTTTLCITIALFVFKFAIPVSNDLYWAFFVTMIPATGVLILVNKIKIIGYAKYLAELLGRSKLLLIPVAAWILLDIINLTYSDEQLLLSDLYSFSINKYIAVVQSTFFFICITIMGYISENNIPRLIKKILQGFIVTGIIATIIVLLNYYYPIVNTININHISLSKDWNVFGGYFIFVYIISQIYICNYNKLSFNVRTLLFAGNAILILQVVLSSVSRRTLYLFILLSVVIAIYFIIMEATKNIKEKIIGTIFALCVFFISIVGGISLNNYYIRAVNENLDIRLERMAICSGRTNTRAFLEGIIFDIVNTETAIKDTPVSEHKTNVDNGDNATKNDDEVVDNEENSSKGQQTVITDIKNPIKERLETAAKNEGFLTDRKALFAEAIDEIEEFDLKSFLFGKGSGYSYLMYKKEPHRTNMLNAGINIDGIIYPHNYLLQDLLEGGLIKCTISIICTGIFGIFLVKKAIKERKLWFTLFLIMCCVLLNILISGSTGFVGDRYFQLCFIISLTYNYYEKRKNDISDTALKGGMQ